MDTKLIGQTGSCGLDLALVEVEQDHVSAIARKLAADLDAHASKGTGHCTDLTLEIEPIVHTESLRWRM